MLTAGRLVLVTLCCLPALGTAVCKPYHQPCNFMLLSHEHHCGLVKEYATNIPLLYRLFRSICKDDPGLCSNLAIRNSLAPLPVAQRSTCACPVLTMYMQIEHSLVISDSKTKPSSIRPGVVRAIGHRARNETYAVRVVDGYQYHRCDVVVEYSMPNIENMRLSGVYNSSIMDKIVYVPAVEWPYSPNPTSRRVHDFMFLYNKHKRLSRRDTIRTSLQKKIKNIIWPVPPIHGEVLRRTLDQTKILINIHQTTFHHTLEEFRLLPALCRGVIVISEEVPLAETVPYHEYIIFAPYEKLIDVAIAVRANYSEYYERIHGANSTLHDVITQMEINASSSLKRILNRKSEKCT